MLIIIFQEVENILRYALERNMTRKSLGAKRHAFDAWRQVVETSFAICSYDVFKGDRREAVILNLLQEMLVKVVMFYFPCFCYLTHYTCIPLSLLTFMFFLKVVFGNHLPSPDSLIFLMHP